MSSYVRDKPPETEAETPTLTCEPRHPAASQHAKGHRAARNTLARGKEMLESIASMLVRLIQSLGELGEAGGKGA